MKKTADVKLQKGDTVFIYASTLTNQDFTKTVLKNVEQKLKEKKINVVVYPEVFIKQFHEKIEGEKILAFAKECNANYIIELSDVNYRILSGYMPPSVVTEPYTYYVNGKMQVRTRTVTKPGYYYTYCDALLGLCITNNIETMLPVFSAYVNTTLTQGTSEEKVSKILAKRIINKITK